MKNLIKKIIDYKKHHLWVSVSFCGLSKDKFDFDILPMCRFSEQYKMYYLEIGWLAFSLLIEFSFLEIC